MLDTALAGQLVTIEDQTTSGVLSPRERFNLAWALNYALLYHYGRCPWVTEGYAPAAHALLLPRGMKPPPGAWNIVLLNTSDQAGALGYHEDEQGSGIPYSEVFVKTAREDGADPGEVLMHEAVEMLVDPDVNKVRTVTHDGLLYIVEPGDPVQGCGYDVGAPEGRTCGVVLADFALPAWFGLPQSKDPERMSFRASVSKPFELAPRGYISTAPVSEPDNWSQTFGSHQDRLPAWASRLPRVHGGKPPALIPCEPRDGHKQHPTERQLLELLPHIDRKVDRMSTSLTNLEGAVADLATAEEAAATELQALEAEVAQLSTSQAPSQEQIDSITSKVQSVSSALSAATTAAEPTAPASPAKAVYIYTPAEGVVTDERFSPSGFETAPAEGAPVPLLYFSGDAAPTDTTGATVPGYAVYVGPTQAVPAS